MSGKEIDFGVGGGGGGGGGGLGGGGGSKYLVGANSDAGVSAGNISGEKTSRAGTT